MSFEKLVKIIHSKATEQWKDHNQEALSELFGSRYHSRAKNCVKLRAPKMKDSESGVSYAA